MSSSVRTAAMFALIASAPSIGFATRPIILTTSIEQGFPQAVCLQRARTALQAAGFVQNPQTAAAWAYGDFNDYAARVWCRPDVVVFIVAGPDNASVNRYSRDIVNRF